MSTLEELSTAIVKATEIANKCVDDLPYSTRGGWMTAIEQAKVEVTRLKLEYKRALTGNGVAIFVSGDPAKTAELTKLVHDEAEGLTADADALYDRLAKAVDLSMGGTKTWGVQQLQKLTSTLMEVMSDLGLKSLPSPAHDKFPYLPTFEDLKHHVRVLVRGAVGDELNALYIEHQAVEEALRIRYIGVMAPVLILNAGPDEQKGLAQGFAKGSATVTLKADETVNKDLMVKIFKDVNKQIKNKKN